jgi:HEAT repeat protein
VKALAGALVLVAAVAATAGAHGPPEKRLRSAPPGTPMPATPPIGPGDVAPRPGPPAGSARLLRALATEASAVVLASVARTDPFDEARIVVYRLHSERVLRGRLDAGEPAVVEIRGGSQRPPLLTDGQHVLLFLAPAPRLTYLAEQVGDEPLLAVVGDRDGIVPVGSEAERAALERALEERGRLAALDARAAAGAQRQLAFAELAAPSPRLVADAVGEMSALESLAPLEPAEVAAAGRALRDLRIDAATRARLATLLGERAGPEALPALAGAATDDATVLDAVLAARARLGAPASADEIGRWLAGADPSLRAAGVRALARQGDPAALAKVGYYAENDQDLTVRVAAVEALGASRAPAAVPVLSRTFAASEPELKQGSARALIQIGGPAVTDALVELALRGESTETQTYAALVLVAARGRDDPAVERLLAAGPGPEVRALLEHGLEFRHSHQH